MILAKYSHCVYTQERTLRLYRAISRKILELRRQPLRLWDLKITGHRALLCRRRLVGCCSKHFRQTRHWSSIEIHLDAATSQIPVDPTRHYSQSSSRDKECRSPQSIRCQSVIFHSFRACHSLPSVYLKQSRQSRQSQQSFTWVDAKRILKNTIKSQEQDLKTARFLFGAV